MTLRHQIFLTVLTAAVFSGCALQSDVRILEDRIIALERRNMELQQVSAELSREKQQIQTQIRGYNEALESKEQSLRGQSAELQAMADRLRNEIQAVRGKFEETDYQNVRKLKGIERQQQNLVGRLRRLEGHLNMPAVSEGNRYSFPTDELAPSPDLKEPAAKQASPSGLSEETLYAHAREAFEKGRYEESREAFRNLIDKFPKGRNSDNAQFWIGETYYREGKYDNAILEYQTVIEKYPRGNKVPDALLKQGFAFYILGDKANARLILKDVISKYPDTNQATRARKKLQNF